MSRTPTISADPDRRGQRDDTDELGVRHRRDERRPARHRRGDARRPRAAGPGRGRDPRSGADRTAGAARRSAGSVRTRAPSPGLAHNAATSATEQALWDLLGQRLGAPVSELLGGPAGGRVRLYANVNRSILGSRSAAAFAAAAREAVAAGFEAVKVAPFDGLRWEPEQERAAPAPDRRRTRADPRRPRCGRARRRRPHRLPLAVQPADGHRRHPRDGGDRPVLDRGTRLRARPRGLAAHPRRDRRPAGRRRVPDRARGAPAVHRGDRGRRRHAGRQVLRRDRGLLAASRRSPIRSGRPSRRTTRADRCRRRRPRTSRWPRPRRPIVEFAWGETPWRSALVGGAEVVEAGSARRARPARARARARRGPRRRASVPRDPGRPGPLGALTGAPGLQPAGRTVARRGYCPDPRRGDRRRRADGRDRPTGKGPRRDRGHVLLEVGQVERPGQHDRHGRVLGDVAIARGLDRWVPVVDQPAERVVVRDGVGGDVAGRLQLGDEGLEPVPGGQRPSDGGHDDHPDVVASRRREDGPLGRLVDARCSRPSRRRTARRRWHAQEHRWPGSSPPNDSVTPIARIRPASRARTRTGRCRSTTAS